jgi:hypothetical protein
MVRGGEKVAGLWLRSRLDSREAGYTGVSSSSIVPDILLYRIRSLQ